MFGQVQICAVGSRRPLSTTLVYTRGVHCPLCWFGSRTLISHAPVWLIANSFRELLEPHGQRVRGHGGQRRANALVHEDREEKGG